MADLSAPITQRLVTFERIGRFRDIDALLLAGDDFDDHAATVYRHARRYLGSKEFSVTVTEDYVSIEVDRFGRGAVRQVATLCRDEDCKCGYPETFSVVPLVDGGVILELLAVGCRRCGRLEQVAA